MVKLKWSYDKEEKEVVTENNITVFFTNELECPDIVIETVIELHNCNTFNEDLVGSGGRIDNYLLDEGECTQEDREIICEEIYKFLQSLKSPIKKLLMEKTLYIPNAEMLEMIRDIFQLKGEPTIWAYDHSFTDDDTVSSGFLTYNGVFRLSKENYNNRVIVTIADISVIE
jgi:hypothetical protein